MAKTETAVKKRVLPPWMTDSTASLKTSPPKKYKKKKVNSSGSSKTRTVYCMNEAELVECALEFLKGENRLNAMDMELVDERSEDQESEEEQQTSPITEFSSPESKPSSSKEPKNSPKGWESHPDSDEDPLKLVREIFFK
ncbi:hypothetical protein GDO86_005043 [Hymenochirus boettgeri]|uniref:Uncharacterized protein n=1 Tax=Hymenochirus boettgeri TaxID=247094 RepID=A0A8T2J7U1_9PIPI|nr:hypothetical protein GDO86_005043 [Hymenochirus boettgeri]